MSILSDNDRLQLQKMIDANQAEDNTDTIRELKHSAKIRNDVNKLLQLKKTHHDMYKENIDNFSAMAIEVVQFLFFNYTDIYNKVLKDEIDISILNKFLKVLKQIEDGEVDQHEGSVLIGELLKSIYIDSALRKSKKLDEENNEEVIEPVEAKPVSWREYKNKYSF
tara:strand:- start:95 stop:592 length:498 start_codon:yes stop_codon:yes gene_type:complete